jgi:O-antigen/teichoic acid export membrane protein
MSMSMLGEAATGYYGLGISLIAPLILIPQAVGQVLYPKINEGIGNNANPKEMRLLVVTSAHALSIFLPAVIGALILIAPAIFHHVFPKYVPGLGSAQILILGSFFICLVRNGVNFLIATDRQYLLLKYVAISLITTVIGNLVLIRLGMGIEGIAISTAFSGALLTSLVWKSVFRGMGCDVRGQWKEIFDLYLPYIVLIALLGVPIMLIPGLLCLTDVGSFWHTAVFLGLYSGLVLLIPPLRQRLKEIYHLAILNIRARSQKVVRGIL